MLSEEREQIILREIVEKGIMKVEELVILTNSSQSTIRRDLSNLEKTGQIKRIHGGAVLNKGQINKRLEEKKDKKDKKEKSEEKISIYKFAASLIEDGDTIYLDAHKSIYEMAKFIDKKDISVVTNGVDNVEKLLEKGIDVYILGGKIKSKTKAVIGTSVFNELKKFRFNKAFIGVNGIDIEFGLTTSDQEEAIIKTKAMDSSKEVFVIADSSKFDKTSFTKISDFKKVTVITDKENKKYRKVLNLKVVN
ncbi:MAG: DeoR/GlpR family DNA-binding transcription regulator [Tissierella sp.]|uniref:DeoR/GlpR family DNA-binding transcription regulator n=1 Tax=Tissierella sp. TaxID=41274 RepID=UPI003F94BA88